MTKSQEAPLATSGSLVEPTAVEWESIPLDFGYGISQKENSVTAARAAADEPVPGFRESRKRNLIAFVIGELLAFLLRRR